MSRRNVPGTLYLLHFSERYRHAGHYLGWTENLEARLAEHEAGNGARLLQVVKASGISWTLARTWAGDRNRERAIKRQGGLSRCCPSCGVTPREPREGKMTTWEERVQEAREQRADSARWWPPPCMA